MVEFFAYAVLGIIVAGFLAAVAAGLLLLLGAVIYIILLPFLFLFGAVQKNF